jgi:hypothetical protein
MRLRPLHRLSLVVGSVLIVVGCFKTPTKTSLMKEASNLKDVTTAQLRTKAYHFIEEFALVVEDAADKILFDADDPTTRLNALRWKMYMVPTAHAAAFNTDPLIAMVDIGVLCEQQERFFTTGGGKDLFGEWQPVAVDAAAEISKRFWRLADTIVLTGDASKARTEIESWAAEHPFDDTYFVRRSIQPLLAEMSGTHGKGMGASLGGIADQVADLSDRLTVYGGSLPKQARWQAELMVRELTAEAGLDAASVQTTATEVGRLIDRLDRTIDAIPEAFPREREAVLAALDDALRGVLADVDRQRIDTIEELRAERVVLLEGLRVEREAVLAAVEEQRAITMTEADGMLVQTVELTITRVEGLVDRLFWRCVVVLAIGAVVLLLIGVVVARVARGSNVV